MAIRDRDTRGCYYLDPGTQSENKRCLERRRQFVMLFGARASGKTTRLFRLSMSVVRHWTVYLLIGFPLPSISLSFERVTTKRVFWLTFNSMIRLALRNPSMNVPDTQDGFLDAFAAGAWNQNVVLLVHEFSELYRASEDIRNECLRI
jgi:hypothetical protein